MNNVRAKKSFGQHFLKNEEIAERIASIVDRENVLEIGPGMGVLSKYLWAKPSANLVMVELDKESVEYLCGKYSEHIAKNRIIEGDFLKLNLREVFAGEQFCLCGNYPYNISSQIMFKALEFRDIIPSICGMFQKEVAERIVSKHGSKSYGILSVYCQTFYEAKYEFTVEACEFNPPPKVRSAVISLKRKPDFSLDIDEKHYLNIIKAAFSQRRKTLRNALSSLGKTVPDKFLSLRAEQLSIEDFMELARALV